MSTCTIRLLFGLAGVFAFILRFDFTVPSQFRSLLLAAFWVFVPAKILAFHLFKLGSRLVAICFGLVSKSASVLANIAF